MERLRKFLVFEHSLSKFLWMNYACYIYKTFWNLLISKWGAIVVIISVKFHMNFEPTGFNNSLIIFRIFRKCFNYFNTYERSRSHTAGIFFYREMFIEKFTINENPYVPYHFHNFFSGLMKRLSTRSKSVRIRNFVNEQPLIN